MDIDNFEWWYSEGEAPDEEWDEPAPRDVSSDEDETGNDAVEMDAASDPVEPLTFEQAWVRHLSAFSTCPRKAPRRQRPRIAPTWLVRKTRAAVLRSAPSSSPSWPA